MGEILLRAENIDKHFGITHALDNVSFTFNKGEIHALIGENGSGKSTLMKTLLHLQPPISGSIEPGDGLKKNEIGYLPQQTLVQRDFPSSVREIVLSGCQSRCGWRPFYNKEEKMVAQKAMEKMMIQDLADHCYRELSGGQQQRVLLARAICQEPEIIVLDEPTSFLDVRYKLELLAILERMARKKHITVIMSLHEIDLAQKVSDKIICVKGDTIAHYGKPEEVFKEDTIRSLYEIDNGSFDPVFGSIELPKIEGEPEVFVISSGGSGIPIYRQLQKEHIPFAAGILYKNDIDHQLARLLAVEVITEEPFRQISDETFARAVEVMKKCKRVIVTDVPVGECNKRVEELIKLAK